MRQLRKNFGYFCLLFLFLFFWDDLLVFEIFNAINKRRKKGSDHEQHYFTSNFDPKEQFDWFTISCLD